MGWSSARSETPSAALGRALKDRLSSKVKRGMKIRVVSPDHLILEDTDEWLSADTHALRLLFAGHVDIDVFPCNSYETSISGLCVSVYLRATSWLSRLVGGVTAVFVLSTVLTWGMAMARLHGFLVVET
jgi:hypothetical protein